MSRITARELALRLLYTVDVAETDPETLLSGLTEDSFTSLRGEDALYEEFPNERERAYIAALLRGVTEHRARLDEAISKYAVGWQIKRIARMTVNILRLCIYEILYMDDIPDASSINEAVEFAKRYDSDEAGAFINGILGSFVRAEKP